MSNSFTNWDDPEYVLGNPDIRQISCGSIGKVLSKYYVACYLPVTMVSFAVDHALDGLEPIQYHVTNLALHLLNIILVYWALSLLVKNKIVAGLAALLFAIHPMQAETVAWVSERKNLLFTIFYLAAAVLYLRSQAQGGRRIWYWASFLAFILACLSKAAAVTLPIAFLLIGWTDRRSWKGLVRDAAPFLAVAAIVGAVAVYGQRAFLPIQQHPHFSIFQHAAIAAYRVVFVYTVRAVHPGLVPAVYSTMPPGPALVASAALLPLTVLAAILFHDRLRIIAASLAFFVINLAPGLLIINVGFTADRYFYLASVGLFLAFGMALAAIPNRPARIAMATTAAVAAMAVFAPLARARAAVWKDSITLWSDAISKYPHEAEYYHKRGASYARSDQFDNAVADFDQAIALDGSYAESYYYRGLALAEAGEHTRAIDDLSRAIGLVPAWSQALEKRGELYYRDGLYRKAIEDFNRCLGLDPGNAALYVKHAFLLTLVNDYAGALSDYDRALALRPGDAEAHFNRALVRAKLGDQEGASCDMATAAGLGDKEARAWLDSHK